MHLRTLVLQNIIHSKKVKLALQLV